MPISNLLRRACCAILPGIVMAAVSPLVAGAVPASAADAVAVRTTRDATDLFSVAVTVRSRGTGRGHHAECLEVAGAYSRTLGPEYKSIRTGASSRSPAASLESGLRAWCARPSAYVFKPGGFDGAAKAVTVPADAS